MFSGFVRIVLLLMIPLSVSAQIDMGIGVDLGAPLMFNKYVGDYNHSDAAPGVTARFSYLPPQATFVPSLNVTVSRYVLPVTRLGATDRVLNMYFAAANAMLCGRVRKQVGGNKELYVGVGIGANYLSGNKVGISGNKSTLTEVMIDSSEYIKRIIPQACINAEILIPFSAEKPVALGVGAQVLYTYFFDQQTAYRVDVVDENNVYYKLSPRLAGSMLTPSIYVALYYRLGQRK